MMGAKRNSMRTENGGATAEQPPVDCDMDSEYERNRKELAQIAESLDLPDKELTRQRNSRIRHRNLWLLNPIQEDKYRALFSILNAPSNAHVLDIGCGKGEVIRLLREYFPHVSGVGVDVDQDFILDARKNFQFDDSKVKFLLDDASNVLKNTADETFNVIFCIGATQAIAPMLRVEECVAKIFPLLADGGYLLLGEGYWKQPPVKEYQEFMGMTDSFYCSLGETIERVKSRLNRKSSSSDSHEEDSGAADSATETGGSDAGSDAHEQIEFLYHVTASEHEWNVYESTCLFNMLTYGDNPESIKAQKSFNQMALKYGRDTLGFALLLFRKRKQSGE